MVRQLELVNGFTALIDDEDWDRVSAWSWRAEKIGSQMYAKRRPRERSGRRATVLLHREITDAGPGIQVDHRNGNGLDCRRSNLRQCTPSQNQANRPKPKNNTTGFKGLQFDGRYGGKWTARIGVNGQDLYLGTFSTPEEAARAYDCAAVAYFGEFAQLNFPLSSDQVA